MTVYVRRPLSLTPALLRKRLPAMYGLPEQGLIDDESVEQFIEDILRSVTWSLCQDKHVAHIKSISSRCGAVLNSGVFEDFFCTESVDELVKGAIGRLRLIGDIVKLQKGRYVPGPPRLVHLDDEFTLFSGGIPTHLLPTGLRDALVPSGSGRLLHGSSDTISGSLQEVPWQALSGWRQTSKVSLSELGRRWFNAERNEIESAEGLGSVQVYAPHLSTSYGSGTSQEQRWVDVTAMVPDNAYLARFQPTFQPYHFGVVSVLKGRVTAISRRTLSNSEHDEKDEAARLRSAIDASYEKPLILSIPSPLSVRLGCSLPRSQSKLLSALARRRPSAGGRAYPQVWRFANEQTWSIWESTLKELGIVIS